MLNFSSILENIRMALRALTANKLRATFRQIVTSDQIPED